MLSAAGKPIDDVRKRDYENPAADGARRYSAMAGAIGGGGLGDLAIRYGYQRFDTRVMLATVVLLIALVQAVQYLENWLARRLTRR